MALGLSQNGGPQRCSSVMPRVTSEIFKSISDVSQFTLCVFLDPFPLLLLSGVVCGQLAGMVLDVEW